MESTNKILTIGQTFTDTTGLETFLSGLTARGGNRGSLAYFGYRPESSEIALDVISDSEATYRSLKVGEKRMIVPKTVIGDTRSCRAIHFAGTGEKRTMLVVSDEGFLAGNMARSASFALAKVLRKDESNVIFTWNPNTGHTEEVYLVLTDRQTPISLTSAGFHNPVVTRDGSILAIGPGGALYRLSADKVAKGTVEASNWTAIKLMGYEGPITSLSLRTQVRDGNEYASGIGGTAFLDVNLANLAKNEVAVTTQATASENVRPIGAIDNTMFAIAERPNSSAPWSNVIVVPPAGGVAALYGKSGR